MSNFKKILVPLSFAALSAQPFTAALAENQNSQNLETLTVTGNRIQNEAFNAPFASEIHSFDDLQKSGAISLYDYLKRFSSVNVTSATGNEFQQKLDMRGYGIENGHQNLVVTLNGRRLNNIDMQPQLLGNIPLDSIERIEILKGSGSVAQGDGAMAGTINIVTRSLNGGNLSFAAGSNGYMSSSLAAGLSKEFFALEVFAENNNSDGVRDPDASGKKDESDANNLSATFKVFPVEGLELRVGRDQSRIDTIYGSPLSKQEYDSNPKQPGSPSWDPTSINNYTEQKYEIDTNRFGVTYQVNNTLRFNLDHTVEKKDSENKTFNMYDKYEYQATDFSTNLNLNNFSMIAGVQLFDGDLQDISKTTKTSKENFGVYLQGQYKLNKTLLSAGARHEKVKYNHKNSINEFNKKRNLNAWDLGINHNISSKLSIFANINKSFQSPDIDRLFEYDFSQMPNRLYNSNIEPAKSKSLNIGFNHLTQRNQLQATLFYSRLKNEIYYYSDPSFVGSTNTNIDKSHKYGLEIQDRFQITSSLVGRVNYAYTVAKIDREDEGAGAYNGKKLPGVSAHSITAGLDYQVVESGTLSLTQNWRSRAYAANDFANNFAQKQKVFNTTDLGYSHQLDKFTLFAQVNNLFDQKNGLWISDGEIYPVNFNRTWYVGAKVSF